MILRVVKYGEPILQKVGDVVTSFDDKLKELANDMIETMDAEDGVGIAAQQVGHALQLFVMNSHVKTEDASFEYELDGKRPPLELIMPLIVVNPRVTKLSDLSSEHEEGCLSFPGIRAPISRCSEIRMDFQDADGNDHVLYATGFLARIVQHEFDHLQGTLFIEKMEKRDIIKNEAKLKKLKRESRDFLKNKGRTKES